MTDAFDASDTPDAPDAPLTAAERVRARVARLVGRLPAAWQLRLAGEPPLVLDGLALDPGLQLLRALRRRRPMPGLVEPSVEAGRRRFRREMRALSTPSEPVGAVRDLGVAGAAGPLRARHYAPAGTAAAGAPLLVYYHGGGFVIGDLETHDAPCRMLCTDGAQHVLSVAYRLAPEHPFPAAVDDALAAYRWARAHAASLGADPARVAVGGDSAGGNLAAVVAQLTAPAGDPPAAQLLVYPATDGIERRPSDALFDEGWFLSQRDRRAFATHYHGGLRPAPGDPRLAPLRAADLSGLAPALVVTAGFDILRDEGEAYAEALRAAGTPVRTLRVTGFGHGFVHVASVLPGARRAMRDVATAWRALLDDATRPAMAGPPPDADTMAGAHEGTTS